MYNTGTQLLDSIDNVDVLVIESEIAVINALLDAYDKASTICEHCDDTSAFDDLFQEAVLHKEEGESKTKTAVLAPLRLIVSLIEKLIAVVKKQLDRIKNEKFIKILKAKIKDENLSIDSDKLYVDKKTGVIMINTRIKFDNMDFISDKWFRSEAMLWKSAHGMDVDDYTREITKAYNELNSSIKNTSKVIDNMEQDPTTVEFAAGLKTHMEELKKFLTYLTKELSEFTVIVGEINKLPTKESLKNKNKSE